MTARMFFSLMLLLLFQLACHQSTQKGKKSDADQYMQAIEELPEATPHSPPPPPPSPPEVQEEVISMAYGAEPEAAPPPPPPPPPPPAVEEIFYLSPPEYHTEEYDHFVENEFQDPLNAPLSTFSVDVDCAAYSNVRRWLNQGVQPPKGAIRVEEMINYFDYNYPLPEGDVPLAIYSEVGKCPWNEAHRLVHIGLQGRRVATEQLPASNLVFLIDVSGSMGRHNKLPLLKNAFKLLVKQLRPNDHVAIVVYAGSSGLVLPSTPGNQKQKIQTAINKMEAGGSTAGASGIRLAYQEARKNFIAGGNNRIILATDGDFNIGISSQSDLVELIEAERESGVFLSVLGFGTGNYKDSSMEQLADHGNGNYAYIDQLGEARKVLVNEFGSTLFTIAKDVKLQVEFNPAQVKAYRLIGYENRSLADKDFNDDLKDAGDIGAGHTVTALYEIIPQGNTPTLAGQVDPLKYQQQPSTTAIAQESTEWMTVKFRYKEPEGKQSKLLSTIITDKGFSPSESFRFSAAVAGFGMLLRDSKFKGNTSYDLIRNLVKGAIGQDAFGYRRGFLDLVDLADLMDIQAADQ